MQDLDTSLTPNKKQKADAPQSEPKVKAEVPSGGPAPGAPEASAPVAAPQQTQLAIPNPVRSLVQLRRLWSSADQASDERSGQLMKLLLSKLRVWMEENSLPAPKLPVPWSTDKGYRRVPLLGPLSSKKGYPSDLLSRLDFSNFLTSRQSSSKLLGASKGL